MVRHLVQQTQLRQHAEDGLPARPLANSVWGEHEGAQIPQRSQGSEVVEAAQAVERQLNGGDLEARFERRQRLPIRQQVVGGKELRELWSVL